MTTAPHHAAPTVAILGLGAMGLPMATRLSGTFAVRGYDPVPASRRRASDTGLLTGDTARDAVAGAQVVLLAVRDEAQVDDVLYGADGVAAVLEAGTVVVLTATVGIEAARQLAPRVEGDDLRLVDAPVSGGAARAGAGDLLIVVGAAEEAYAMALPVLERLASTVQLIGPRPGDGQAMKTVNQLLCGVHVAAAAEALALAQTLGLDPASALETLGAGAASSFMLGDRGPRMLQAYEGDGAEVRSRLDIFVKDLGIVSRTARLHGLATPVAAAAEQLFLLGQQQGLSGRDDSTLIRILDPEGPGRSQASTF